MLQTVDIGERSLDAYRGVAADPSVGRCLVAEWKVISGDESLFSVTKAIHNELQGAERSLNAAEPDTAVRHAWRPLGRRT